MEAAFVYARPKQFKSTGLSNNTAQCAAVLSAAGHNAVAIALDEIVGDQNNAQAWAPWMEDNQPRLVVLGAFIVPLGDLEFLARSYPDTVWVQRCHSNLAWLFQTGDMARWLDLLRNSRDVPNLHCALVSESEAFRWQKAGVGKVFGIPNVLGTPIADHPRQMLHPDKALELSAFFAIRLLKHPGGHVLTASIVNQSRPARLHMQCERTDSPKYIEHIKRLANTFQLRMPLEPYRDHDVFLLWLAANIDIGLQLSMSESFNYVALEHLARAVPVVTSEAVDFCPWRVQYEDAAAAAEMVLKLTSNAEAYREASEQALAAARAVQGTNNARFVDICTSLLGGNRV